MFNVDDKSQRVWAHLFLFSSFSSSLAAPPLVSDSMSSQRALINTSVLEAPKHSFEVKL